MKPKTKDYGVASVDPFWGNGTICLPEPEGIAARWFFIKAQSGNTSPAAALPFGWVTAGAYSGAYPTGYGINDINTFARPRQLFDRARASGFTHFHVSGTGSIGHYYNYFRVIPSVGAVAPAGDLAELGDELAEPGYYATTLRERGVRAELTVAPGAAVHRYRFDGNGVVAVDFLSGGLGIEGMRATPSALSLRILSDHGAEGFVEQSGVRFYVRIEVESASGCHLWTSGGLGTERSFDSAEAHELPDALGVQFNLSGTGPALLRIGFSMRGLEQAASKLETIRNRTFDEIRGEALAAWNGLCSSIELREATPPQRTIFYSALYHSFVKPVDCWGESPFYEDPADYFTDIATLWDQYKTQLPLVFTLEPEKGARIIRSLLAIADHLGEFPNAVLLADDWSQCRIQARALAHYVIADGFNRKLPGVDWEHALECMVRDIRKPANEDFWKDGEARPAAHMLDLVGACFCTAALADAMGKSSTAQELRDLAGSWKRVFDPATGRLKDSTYYEGGSWNYSFRLLPNMAERIGLYANEESFVSDLEQFFGFGAEAITQPWDPDDPAYAEEGIRLGRFQGLNNEPDMETPYAFIYAGRHDRTAEVVRSILKYQFTTGPGGLPGNNDSGGLSSWLVWSACGLFPVAGQPFFLIGSPIYPETRIRLPEAVLRISAEPCDEDHIYVCDARWNGVPLPRAWLTMEEFLQGGHLSLVMGRKPSGWSSGAECRPPRGDRPIPTSKESHLEFRKQ